MPIIMSWSECSISIAKTGANDAMGTPLVSIGTIKDKSTSLTTSDGDKLTAKATGGKLIAQAQLEGETSLTTRVVEADFTFLASLLGATLSGGELPISTLVVSDPYSVQLTPKLSGANGLKIRKTHVSVKEGYSEDEGSFVDLTFTFLTCADGVLYTKYKKA